MRLNSAKIALGGVFSSLCVVMMFMTGLVPFATYILPAAAGAMLTVVVIENGSRIAVAVYAGVSALSFFMAPDREAVMLFIVFLGYYPIVKEKFERIRSRLLEYVCKAALFNISVVVGYSAIIAVLGLPLFAGGSPELVRYGPFVMLVAGNVVFFLYDVALTRYISVYIRWFKPRFLRK